MNITNIEKLPYDIHSMIFDNLEDGRDIYNFKNTCKSFNNYVNNEVSLNSNIFKIKYKIVFNNCDINKHSVICKKMWIILKDFKLYEIHFNRTHNSCKSIFDTQTIIYVSMFTDNINEHKMKLFKLLNKNNINNYYISFNITIYFSDSFINQIINYHNKNNNDILINNESLQKINKNEENLCIREFEKIFKNYFYSYELDNDKLYIKKSEIISFLIKMMTKQEKEIERGILIMEFSQNYEEIIKKKMNELDIIVGKLNKFRNMMIKLENNIKKNQKLPIKRKLESEFMMNM